MKGKIKLPCGVILKNAIGKSPMSDSLGDGKGNPTKEQIRLYERWAEGGTSLSIIGEVQLDYSYPERPGNLVLNDASDIKLFKELTSKALINGSHLWAQIGHAGALSHLPISKPKGPSLLDIEGLKCEGMSLNEVKNLPSRYAKAASKAKELGFSGVQIHAGHGFLLSQFLSPLFNKRDDEYGGDIKSRCKIILQIINSVRIEVGDTFPISIRINSSDNIEGGLTQKDSLKAIGFLDKTSLDLIDISGGTYFPGAKASSDSLINGPYFLEFAKKARKITSIPLMISGGFKKKDEVQSAISSGVVDMVSIGRGMIIDTNLANTWINNSGSDPIFPKFEVVVPGGITAWYTMRLTAIANDDEDNFNLDLINALESYEKRDNEKCFIWKKCTDGTSSLG